jgi:hypothetical protein
MNVLDAHHTERFAAKWSNSASAASIIAVFPTAAGAARTRSSRGTKPFMRPQTAVTGAIHCIARGKRRSTERPPRDRQYAQIGDEGDSGEKRPERERAVQEEKSRFVCPSANPDSHKINDS